MIISSSTSAPLMPSVSASLNNSERQSGEGNASSKDLIELSGAAHRLMNDFLARQAGSAFEVIPADQRPTAQQSADVILGFIGQRLQARADEGASDEALEKTLDDARKGFMRGFVEAFKMIEGMGLMREEVRQSITDTKFAVFDGLEILRERYLADTGASDDLPDDSADTLVSQVTAFTESTPFSGIAASSAVQAIANAGQVQAAATLYAQSYRRNESIDFAVQTRDGDIVTLHYSSNLLSSSNITAFLSNSGQHSAQGQAVQNSVSASTRFNVSVQGELDHDEMQALESLLTQVAALSDELFNGDFDTAVLLANAFELDTREFSALSLDIARSTRTTVVQAHTVAQHNSAGSGTELLPASELDIIGKILEQLSEAMETAQRFNEPVPLLSNLLGNHVAQHALVASGAEAAPVARLLDELLDTLS